MHLFRVDPRQVAVTSHICYWLRQAIRIYRTIRFHKTGTPIPILRMLNEARVKVGYLDFLGFTLDWEHHFEAALALYIRISKDGCILHLSEHLGDGTPAKPWGLKRPSWIPFSGNFWRNNTDTPGQP